MLGHQNKETAPFRIGCSYGEKDDRVGTKMYWYHYTMIGEEQSHIHGDLVAGTEEAAGELALAEIGVEKPEDSEWQFTHECSRNRGYEIHLPGGTLTLFHVLSNW